jgi:hypothetical protein
VAIVIGYVSPEERQQIVAAGYTLSEEHSSSMSFMEWMRACTLGSEQVVAVYVDCEVTDLLVLDKERTNETDRDSRTGICAAR